MKIPFLALILFAGSPAIGQTSDGPNNSPDEIRAAENAAGSDGGTWKCTRYDFATPNAQGESSVIVCVNVTNVKNMRMPD